MARTYGHPDPTRNAQPSQHRNTLKVQDALRAIQHGDTSSKSHISKDDFLDFICSFPRLYRVGGVIGDRLTQWRSANEALVRSWDPEINQLRPGFFREREEDEADGVELPAPGNYVKREERGLPETFAEDGISAKKPRARKEAGAGEDRARDVPPRPRTSRRAGPKVPELGALDGEPFGTPLAAAITAKYPSFAGRSVEQVVLQTAQAAQHDMDRIRKWFRAQRRVLDPGDALVDKFAKLEAELPRYEQFVGVAEMIVQLAKSQKEAENKLKRQESDKGEPAQGSSTRKINGSSLVTPVQSTHSAPLYEAGEVDDEDQDYDDDYYDSENITPSKPPAVPGGETELVPPASISSGDKMNLDGRRLSTEGSTANSLNTGDSLGVKGLSLETPPDVDSPSDLSDLSTVPNLQSTESSRRVSTTDIGGLQIPTGLEEMDWDEEDLMDGVANDDPEDESYKPRPSSKRKRKRTRKALESGVVELESAE